MKPIETFYRGYRFRSRLEARWAVFLDAAEIPWQYEVEGFDLGFTYYLPDFWLPHDKTFLEIKPHSDIAYVDLLKQVAPTLTALANTSACEAYLIVGSPDPTDFDPDHYERPRIIGFAPHAGPCSARLFACPFCGKVSFGRLTGSWWDAACQCRPGVVFDHDQSPFTWPPRLQHAMQEARCARFEHGEDGRPPPYRRAAS